MVVLGVNGSTFKYLRNEPAEREYEVLVESINCIRAIHECARKVEAVSRRDMSGTRSVSEKSKEQIAVKENHD